jgi:hypothetical protein
MMKRAHINAAAEQFFNRMVAETMAGAAWRSGAQWFWELKRQYPSLSDQERKRIANKVVRYIKAAGSPNDATM